MQNVHNNHRPTSLMPLLALYIQGHIDEDSWTRIMKTIDQKGISYSERAAYARFLNELYAPRQAA